MINWDLSVCPNFNLNPVGVGAFDDPRTNDIKQASRLQAIEAV